MDTNSFKDKITFFYYWEEKFWGDKVDANKYFCTVCIIAVAIIGALTGGGNALKAMFKLNTEISPIASAGLCIFIWGLNMAESIVASNDALTALKRTMLILACIAGTYIASGLLAVLVIIIVSAIVAIYIFLTLLGGLLDGSSSSSGSRREKEEQKLYDTEDGAITGNLSFDSRTLYGDNGKKYYRESLIDKFKEVD